MTLHFSEIQRENMFVTATYLAPSGVVDALGYTFLGFVRNAGGNSVTYVVQMYDQAGAKVSEWVGACDNGHKIDGGMIFPSGADLEVVVIAHQINGPDPNHRDLSLNKGTLPGVFGPYHQGEYPGDAPGSFFSNPGLQGGSGVTLDELTAATNDPNSAYRHALKNAVKAFVGEALAEAGVLRAGSSADEKFGILAQNIRDRAYEAIVSYFGPKK